MTKEVLCLFGISIPRKFSLATYSDTYFSFPFFIETMHQSRIKKKLFCSSPFSGSHCNIRPRKGKKSIFSSPLSLPSSVSRYSVGWELCFSIYLELKY